MAKRLRVWVFLCLLILTSLLLQACSLDKQAAETRWLVVAADEKLEQSGLLAQILPPFEQANSVRIKLLPVDTQRAITYARNGGVDVLLVSGGAEMQKLAGPAPEIPPFSDKPQATPTPSAEPTPTPTALPFDVPFAERKIAFWSQMVLVGPADDPNKIKEQYNLAKALQKLANVNAPIIIPGREPGIQEMLEGIWGLTGKWDVPSRGTGYRIIDGTASDAMQEAARVKGYTVTPLDVFSSNHPDGTVSIVFNSDRATFLKYEITIRNYISIPGQDISLSRKFSQYLLSSSTQEAIASYKNQVNTTPLYRPGNFPVYVP